MRQHNLWTNWSSKWMTTIISHRVQAYCTNAEDTAMKQQHTHQKSTKEQVDKNNLVNKGLWIYWLLGTE